VKRVHRDTACRAPFATPSRWEGVAKGTDPRPLLPSPQAPWEHRHPRVSASGRAKR